MPGIGWTQAGWYWSPLMKVFLCFELVLCPGVRALWWRHLLAWRKRGAGGIFRKIEAASILMVNDGKFINPKEAFGLKNWQISRIFVAKNILMWMIGVWSCFYHQHERVMPARPQRCGLRCLVALLMQSIWKPRACSKHARLDKGSLETPMEFRQTDLW